jgi:hypothetical protein
VVPLEGVIRKAGNVAMKGVEKVRGCEGYTYMEAEKHDEMNAQWP